jgi:hypothetical protein
MSEVKALQPEVRQERHSLIRIVMYTEVTVSFGMRPCAVLLACRQPLWSSEQSSWIQNGDVLCFL